MGKALKADRIAAQAAGVAAKRGVGDRAQSSDGLGKEPPVPEQARFFTSKAVAVRTEMGQVTALAYRRQPYFITLAKLPADPKTPKGHRLITSDQLRAMRFYRSAWEATQASATHCALDVSLAGGRTGYEPNIPMHMWESSRVADCERDMKGWILATLRAVVLDDQSFAAVAMNRWGSRERQRIIVGKGKEKPRVVNEIVPKSSAHAGMVRDEFLCGVAILSRSVGAHLAIE
jgi:hypothetical protein